MLLKITLFVLAALSTGYSRKMKYEPCDTSNVECITNELAARSTCDKYRVWGTIAHQITKLELYYESPFFRASHRDQFLTIQGLDKCEVGVFYTNRATNATVLGIECRGIYVEAKRSVRKHYPFKEDEQHFYHITADYDCIRLTMNLPDTENLDICSEKAYASFDSLPAITIEANDQETKEFLDGRDYNIKDHLDIYVHELLLFRATALFRYIVNSLLCLYQCDDNLQPFINQGDE